MKENSLAPTPKKPKATRWSKWFKSLQGAFIARYTLFLIFTILLIFVISGIYLGSIVSLVESAQTSPEPKVIQVAYKTATGDIIITPPPSDMIWVDVIDNGDLVASAGDRQITDLKFSQEFINDRINNLYFNHGEDRYTSKVYLFTGEDQRRYTAIVYASLQSGLKVGMDLPPQLENTEFEQKFYLYGQVALALMLVAVISAVFLFSRWSVRTLFKPLARINTGLSAIQEGNLDTQIPNLGYSELEEIKKSFNDMAMRLRVSEDAARSLSQSKRQMVLDLSHDLRSPATVIQGYAQAICDGRVPDDKISQYAAYILQKSETLTQRIQQLFRFTLLDTSQFALKTEVVDAMEFMRQLVIRHLPDIENNGFELEIEIQESKVYTALDAVEMERAIGNLIENAMKYNPPGTTLSVNAYGEKMGDEDHMQVVILLSDNGVGIPKAMHQTIFDPFVRLDPSRPGDHRGGTGLGLAITKQIIALHGGTISILPRDVGSVFKVVLPSKSTLV